MTAPRLTFGASAWAKRALAALKHANEDSKQAVLERLFSQVIAQTHYMETADLMAVLEPRHRLNRARWRNDIMRIRVHHAAPLARKRRRNP